MARRVGVGAASPGRARSTVPAASRRGSKARSSRSRRRTAPPSSCPAIGPASPPSRSRADGRASSRRAPTTTPGLGRARRVPAPPSSGPLRGRLRRPLQPGRSLGRHRRADDRRALELPPAGCPSTFSRGIRASCSRSRSRQTAAQIATGGEDGTVRLWSCEICGGVDRARRVADARLARTGRSRPPRSGSGTGSETGEQVFRPALVCEGARSPRHRRLYADRRPAQGDRRDLRLARGGEPLPDPARRHGHGQDGDDGVADREAPAARRS